MGELTDLGGLFQKYFDGTDGTRPWENKDPLSIVKLIDNFIQELDGYEANAIAIGVDERNE